MRTFAPFFASLIAKRKVDLFWSVEVPYAGGIFYLADRNEWVAGKRFRNALLSSSPIESIISEDDRVLEVGALTISIDNFPGRMADGSRFSDHVNEKFQSRFVSVYANAVGGAFGITRELMFVGVPRGRPRRETDKVTFRLVPLSEHYLTAPVLRIVRPDFYPEARESDIGRAIPWVVAGTVRSVDGILRRPRQATIPVADEDNQGDAQLGRPTITKDSVGETWTITAFDAQPTRVEGTPAIHGGLGNAFNPFWNANGRQTAYGWSFHPKADGNLRGVTIQVKSANFASSFHGFFVICSLSTAGAGHEPVFIQAFKATNLVVAADTTYVDLYIPLIWPLSTDYWTFELGWYMPAGVQAKFWPGQHVGLFGDQVNVGLVPMPEDYDGKFFYGGVDPNWTHSTLIADLYAKYPNEQFWPANTQETGPGNPFDGYHDDADFGGRMIVYQIDWFEEIFNRYVPFYKVEGTASGFQGYGTYDEDFVAPNGRLKIPSSLWSGTPVHGDKWTFTTPGKPAQIVFAESRGDSPVSAIQDVHINEIPIAESGDIITKFFGAWDGEGLVAMIQTYAEVREEWRVRADLTASGSTNAGEVMLRTIRRAGVPDEYIDLVTWATTIATLSGWNFAGMVADEKDYKAVLLDEAFQCRSTLRWTRDKASLVYIPDPGSETLVGTITPSDLFLVDPNGSAKPNHYLEQTDAARVVNKVVVRYGRNWSLDSGPNGYTGVKEAKSSQSIADFRERADDPTFVCDFITSGAIAQLLANFELARRNYPDDEYVATLRLPWMKLEPGDAFTVDVP